MKLLLRFLLLLFIIDSASAQVNTDSLLSIWQDELANDTARLESWNKYIWSTSLFVNPDTAYFLAQEHFDFAEAKSLPKYMGQALSTQGVTFAIRGEYDSALSYYSRSLEIFEKVGYKKGIASIANNMGVIHADRGDLKSAIEDYKKSLQMMKELGNIDAAIKAENNIGNVYMEKGDIANAMVYFQMGFSTSESSGNTNGMINSLNNIAILYNTVLEHEKALNYFKQCLELIDETVENRLYLEASALNNIGTSYSFLGQNEIALDYYMRSLELKKQLNNPFDVALMLNNIGAIYKDLDDLIKAEGYLQESLSLYGDDTEIVGINMTLANLARVYARQGRYIKAIELANDAYLKSLKNENLEGINSASEILYKCYRATKNDSKALEMLEVFQMTRDTLLSVENQKEIISHSFRYEYEKKVAADSLKALEERIKTEARIATQKAQLEKERIQRFSLYGGIGILLVFAGFIFNRYQVSQKQKQIIESQKDQVEEQRSQLSIKNQKITDSIEYAKRIQTAILPPYSMVEEMLGEAFVLYIPKDVVAGDFYWLRKMGETIFFAAADCTGHGVPGAMVSVVCNSALNRAVGEFGLADPGEILDKTRDIVLEEFEKAEEEVKDGMDIALCSLKGNELKYAGANNPLWFVRDGVLEVIRANKQPVGMHLNHEAFTTHQVNLQPGDSIYIFTDGFADQFGGPKGKKFKPRALQNTIIDIQSKSLRDQKPELQKTFNNWKGSEEQVDDVCIIGFRFLG